MAKDLKENLFADSSFFSKRLLIFPNGTVKEWIYKYLSDDPKLKGAFGIIPLYLNEALDILIDKFFISTNVKKSLSPLQLILKIEENLGSSFPSCQSLAFLFERYGLYGTPFSKDEFQEELWKKVYANHTYPLEIFENLREKDEIDSNYSIHIFGFNHLAPLHFSFFQRLSKKLPVYFYHLSPCLEFWSDIKSDKEAKRFFSKAEMQEKFQVTWEEYLEDRHPLLANLGKMGKEFATLVEESELITVENYEDPQIDTELHALQQAILYLKESPHKAFEDDSIQIHILTTRHREVENLYNILSSLMCEKGISPSEIVVMAPDITLYAPYISACFQKIPFRICDMPIFTEEKDVLGLFQILELEEKRWSSPSVMALFSHPLFQKKQKWKEEDLYRIRNWIDKGEIRWGVNLDHINHLLKKKHCKTAFNDGNTTWEAGLKRLYKNFALFEEAGEMNIVESDLLGELSFLISSLYNDLRSLHDDTEKTLQEWVDVLRNIYSAYFVEEDSTTLFSKLDIIKNSGFHKKYRFKTLLPLLRDFLSKEKTTVNRHQLQSVMFCSLLPNRVIPAKVVCLLGMQHDAFPHKERLSSFDLLKKGKTYYPTITDSDRYLFLETLLAAKDYFIISYLGKSLQDQMPVPESSVVFELRRAANCKNTVVHPDASFDPIYFQNQHSLLKNYSHSDYKAALSLFQPKKEIRSLFKKEIPSTHIPEGEHVIDINELKRVFRYPITYFLENNFKISFFDEKEAKEEEDFLLSPLHLGTLRKSILSTSSEEVLKRLEKKGGSPLAEFKNLALFRLKNEEAGKGYFKTFTSLEFSLYEKDNQTHDSKRAPLIFPYDEKRKILFVGKLENVTEKGLFIFDRCQMKAAVKHWSDFLILNSARNTPQTLFFGKDKKEKVSFFEDASPFLKRVIDYFFYAKTHPLFLLPEWVEAILKRDVKKLELLIDGNETYDKGALFAKRALSGSEIIENCGTLCDNLYKDMKDAWF